MKHHISIMLLATLLLEGSAQACGTCAIDQGSVGQTLMLVSMMAVPLVVGGLGAFVIRRLLRSPGSL